MRIIKNHEDNVSNASQSVSSSSNIPVAMLTRGWKLNSNILLGSVHPVPCPKWCMQSCLYQAVLSKIPLQLSSLHLKAIDCCPPPGWRLPLFYLLMVARSQADLSNEHWRCAPNCSLKMADTDNTQFSAAFFIYEQEVNRLKSGTILITLTMAWHWETNCNVDNPGVCFVLATTNSNLSVFSS